MKEFTTIEKLQCEAVRIDGAVLKYNDHVFFTYRNWKGEYFAEVFEFVETPEEIGLDEIECRLLSIYESKEKFIDGGHAVAWCFEQVR